MPARLGGDKSLSEFSTVIYRTFLFLGPLMFTPFFTKKGCEKNFNFFFGKKDF
jgi:hypothetical protein